MASTHTHTHTHIGEVYSLLPLSPISSSHALFGSDTYILKFLNTHTHTHTPKQTYTTHSQTVTNGLPRWCTLRTFVE